MDVGSLEGQRMCGFSQLGQRWVCVCVLSEEQQLRVDLFKDPVGEINSGRSRVALPGLWVHFCHRGQRSTFSQKQSNDSVMTGLMFLCFGGVNVP